MRRIASIVASSVLVLGITACGSSSDNGKTSSTPAEPAGKAKPAGATGETKVSMKNIKFIPMNIQAKVGQKITWTNDDPVAHTVTAEKGGDFDSGTVNSGGTFSFTPKAAGTIDYVCTIHPGQTGTITVTK
jgi:plastocyanin